MTEDPTSKIVAIVVTEKGSQGFEISYNKSKSLESYVSYFESEARRLLVSQRATVWYVETTTHREDGTIVRDDEGVRVMNRLYTNKDIKFG